MRWLLVFLACCFCVCSYAGRYSCGNRCKGYMTNNADYHHNADGSYDLICEDCGHTDHIIVEFPGAMERLRADILTACGFEML